MQAVQPLLKALNDKYKDIPAKDPRKQEQQQEMMALYQKHGINPVGGCVPMLLQIPFFIALYTVLSLAIEMRGATWLWVSDLSQPETMSIRMLPMLMMVTQFVSQKLTPSPGMDPSQQKMMMLMPLVFVAMFWGSPAGLVLYWLTSNVVSIVQQGLLNRMMPSPAPIQVAPAPKKKK
jgi:YidC/Oxa1 family membrane protein insertase